MNAPISKGERCIIVDAGSEEGFFKGARLIYDGKSTSGDYHGEMSSEKFIGWLRGQLIPNYHQNQWSSFVLGITFICQEVL